MRKVVFVTACQSGKDNDSQPVGETGNADPAKPNLTGLGD